MGNLSTSWFTKALYRGLLVMPALFLQLSSQALTLGFGLGQSDLSLIMTAALLLILLLCLRCIRLAHQTYITIDNIHQLCMTHALAPSLHSS